MARMHSRRRGKSGSSRPATKDSPTWVDFKPKEIEMLIAKLAKQGETASLIGIHLRDSYGIPSVKVVTGKTVSQILEEKNLSGKLPEDMENLIKRSISIVRHIEENGQDKTAKRGLQLTQSKIRRLAKYYQKSGKLDPAWRFRQDQATFYVDE